MLPLRHKEWDRTIPFGPFIALGAFVASVWGGDLLRWYLSLFA
jgi:prepilin signal peptidase PulO-like enzyme (type II secretory pathway)